jgi:hypothetical protein
MLPCICPNAQHRLMVGLRIDKVAWGCAGAAVCAGGVLRSGSVLRAAAVAACAHAACAADTACEGVACGVC